MNRREEVQTYLQQAISQFWSHETVIKRLDTIIASASGPLIGVRRMPSPTQVQHFIEIRRIYKLILAEQIAQIEALVSELETKRYPDEV